mgnify:FL=1
MASINTEIVWRYPVSSTEARQWASIFKKEISNETEEVPQWHDAIGFFLPSSTVVNPPKLSEYNVKQIKKHNHQIHVLLTRCINNKPSGFMRVSYKTIDNNLYIDMKDVYILATYRQKKYRHTLASELSEIIKKIMNTTRSEYVHLSTTLASVKGHALWQEIKSNLNTTKIEINTHIDPSASL